MAPRSAQTRVLKLGGCYAMTFLNWEHKVGKYDRVVSVGVTRKQDRHPCRVSSSWLNKEHMCSMLRIGHDKPVLNWWLILLFIKLQSYRKQLSCCWTGWLKKSLRVKCCRASLCKNYVSCHHGYKRLQCRHGESRIECESPKIGFGEIGINRERKDGQFSLNFEDV